MMSKFMPKKPVMNLRGRKIADSLPGG